MSIEFISKKEMDKKILKKIKEWLKNAKSEDIEFDCSFNDDNMITTIACPLRCRTLILKIRNIK